MTVSNRLISHKSATNNIQDIVKNHRQRIIASGEMPDCSVEEQLYWLEQLASFELGRFLLKNRGLNGYWTHYILTYPECAQKAGESERFLLERLPSIKATRWRFKNFLKENQKSVHNNAVLACIPSGLMAELLYLNYEGIDTITLAGIDLDASSLSESKKLAKKHSLLPFLSLSQQDAWALNRENYFDLISSNGLNIYEQDTQRLTELYQTFYKALKPQGKLVSSFFTNPPNTGTTSEWVMEHVDLKGALLEKMIFGNIVQAHWLTFSSSEHTFQLLKRAGFKNIEFIYDPAHIMPTIIAEK